MSALSALASYSDDDDDEEVKEEVFDKKIQKQQPTNETKEVEQSADAKYTTKQQQQSTTSPSPVHSTLAPPQSHSLPPSSPPKTALRSQETEVIPEAVRRHLGSIDKVRQRRSLLRSKPVEGVENWGIPPEPTTECDPERRESIERFIALRRSGHRLNEHLERNKSFRNPRIYAKLVEFIDLDEIGSNFDKSEFDPHGFPPEATIDGILDAQRRFAEEKLAQQQNRSSIPFVSSSSSHTPAAAAATGGAQQNTDQLLAAAMANAAKVASRITQEQQGVKRESGFELSSRGDHHASKRQR